MLLGPVRPLVRYRVGIVDWARPVVVLEGGAAPVALDELPKGQWRIVNSARLLLLSLLPALLKGLSAPLVASLVQVVGHEGTGGCLSQFVLVVIIVETFAALSSCLVHDGFPVRRCTQLVHAAVAPLQPLVPGLVLLLLEHLLSDPVQHIVAAHSHHDGQQTVCPAAHLTLVQAPDCCLLAIT